MASNDTPARVPPPEAPPTRVTRAGVPVSRERRADRAPRPAATTRSRAALIAVVAVLAVLLVAGIGIAAVAESSGVGGRPGKAAASSERPDAEPTAEPTNDSVVVNPDGRCDRANLSFWAGILGVRVDDLLSIDDPADPVALGSGIQPICGFQVIDPPDYTSHVVQTVFFEGTREIADAINDHYLDEGFRCEPPDVIGDWVFYSCFGDNFGTSMYLYDETYGPEAPVWTHEGPVIKLTSFVYE